MDIHCPAVCHKRFQMPPTVTQSRNSSEWSLEALNPVFTLLQYSDSFEDAFKNTKTFCRVIAAQHACIRRCPGDAARVLGESLKPTQFLCAALAKERALINCMYLHINVLEAQCLYEKTAVERLLNSDFVANLMFTNMEKLDRICRTLKELEQCHLQQTDAYCRTSSSRFWRRLLNVTQTSFVRVVQTITRRHQLPAACTDPPYWPPPTGASYYYSPTAPAVTNISASPPPAKGSLPSTTEHGSADDTAVLPSPADTRDNGDGGGSDTQDRPLDYSATVVVSDSGAASNNTSWLTFYYLRAVVAVLLRVALYAL